MPSPFAFKDFDPKNLMTLLDAQLDAYQSAVDAILKNSHEDNPFETLVLELEKASSQFTIFWQPINHLNSVKKTDELTKVYSEAQKKVSEFHSAIYQNQDLYQLFITLKQSKHFETATDEQKKLVDDMLLGFKHSGVELSTKEKKQLTQFKTELTTLQESFQNNVTQSTAQWNLLITEEDKLKGIPEQALNQMKKEAQDKGQQGWLVTLNPSISSQVMDHAENRELRKAVFEAGLIVASPEGDSQFDNSQNILKILKLKQNIAQLLGYDDYVDYSLSDKMATRQQVQSMHETLRDSLRPLAIKEAQQLKQFAKEHLGIEDLELYDKSYVSSLYKKERFNLDDKVMMEYFPVDKVLQGMFEVVNRLFGITLKEEKEFDTWDEDVRLFSVFRENGEKCGEIYMDLFARNGEKRSGAWMNECVPRLVTQEGVQNPIAFLSTNFGKGDGSKPSLLNHREVRTTFHEFGHCLHHVLSQAQYPSLCGPNGVPWDAVESPSQMMENWIWDAHAIKLFSQHYLTKEPLPQSMMSAISGLRDYMSATGTLGQLAFSTFDFNIYDKNFQGDSTQVLALWKKVCDDTLVGKRPTHDYFPNKFQHIFAGGYSAGYFVYNWALNIAHDMFSEFKKKGIFDHSTGRRYLHEVLEPGGIRPFMDLVVSFLGRAPNPNALAQALMRQVAPEAENQAHQAFEATNEAAKSLLISFKGYQPQKDQELEIKENEKLRHALH